MTKRSIGVFWMLSLPCGAGRMRRRRALHPPAWRRPPHPQRPQAPRPRRLPQRPQP